MSQLADRIEGIVHEPTQVREDGRVDLTVANVHRIASPGRVDFGGGELDTAETEPIETALRNADDDYEWWHLGPGQYVIEHNERLSDETAVRLQTRTAVLERGAFHPTVTVSSFPSLPFSIGCAGLLLKENARITTAEAV